MNIIFDFDGCLADSSEVQKAAFFGAYEEVVGDGNCPSYEEYIKYTGDSVDNVMAKLHLPKEMSTVFRRISSESIEKIEINANAIELVKYLRDCGCRIALCTGKDRYRTADILKYYDINKYFDTLVCADDVSQPKPSPEPIFKALTEMGCGIEDAIMIGDGYGDICSAKNAGVRSVLTLWYGDNGVPREADYVVNSVEELKDYLNKLMVDELKK